MKICELSTETYNLYGQTSVVSTIVIVSVLEISPSISALIFMSVPELFKSKRSASATPLSLVNDVGESNEPKPSPSKVAEKLTSTFSTASLESERTEAVTSVYAKIPLTSSPTLIKLPLKSIATG